MEDRHLSQAAKELVFFVAQINPPPGALGLVGEGRSLEDRLAAHLVHHAGFLLKNQPEAALRLLVRLQREYATSFSSPALPGRALEWYPRQDGEHPLGEPGA